MEKRDMPENLITNMHALDRLLRILLAIVCIELAYFWLAGGWRIVAGVAGAILLATAVKRFCPLYRLAGISTLRGTTGGTGAVMQAIAAALLVAVLAGGAVASSFFTRKLFLEDFNAMNNYYKQTLFLTGRNEREKAVANYDLLLTEYRRFQDKYASYRPYVLKGDAWFDGDLSKVAGILAAVDSGVSRGDLQQAHLDLEQIRPVFQEMFKRNGFSLLAVALVDFHDAMEPMLEAANARDPAKLVALYAPISDKLKAVEAEANDSEIQAIRSNLDELVALARAARLDQLPGKGEQLKSSFVKVYLKRG
jgi:hypothetical protein